jgi:hypothetical protein
MEAHEPCGTSLNPRLEIIEDPRRGVIIACQEAAPGLGKRIEQIHGAHSSEPIPSA